MRVQAYGNIKPAAKFGVPDGDAIVFPGGDVVGYPVLSVPLVKSGWGSMPRYREDDEAIKLCLTLGTITFELKDNFFIARGEFSNIKEAQKSISDSLQIFFSSLSVVDSALYTYEIDTYLMNENEYYTPPPPISWRFIGYNTSKLGEKMNLAADLWKIKDQRLERGMFYFNLSLVVYGAAQDAAKGSWDWFTGLVSSALLNLYKAATSIIGDPSQRGDKHQKRTKDLSLTDDEIAGFKDIKRFRDSFDVAHYTLNKKEADEIHGVFEKQKNYVSNLILKYSKNV